MHTMKNMALDYSARSIDDDGRLHVNGSHISKAEVSPYYGREIPDWENLGLDPDKIYKLLRDPKEVEKGAASFANLPILKKHVPISADDMDKDLIIGSIGSNVSFKDPYLDADQLCFWDAEAIAGIDTGKIKELSCAYRYKPVMVSGEYKGQPYDGIMTDIKGNHLALVETGRAGPDVVVADQCPFSLEIKSMKMTKLGKAMYTSLCAASPKLAADSALPALVGKADRKSFDKASVKSKLIALDGDMDPQQIDNVIDALLDVEQPNPAEPNKEPMEQGAGDEDPAAKLRQLLEGKVAHEVIEEAVKLFAAPAHDAGVEPKDMSKENLEAQKIEPEAKKPEEAKAAMDAAISKAIMEERKKLMEAQQARQDVRSVVGDLDVAMDSAEAIYGFALDQMGIEHKDVSGVPALRTIFAVGKKQSKSTVVAQDAGGLVTRFPNAARFRNA